MAVVEAMVAVSDCATPLAAVAVFVESARSLYEYDVPPEIEKPFTPVPKVHVF